MSRQTVAERNRKLRAFRKASHKCERCGHVLPDGHQFVSCDPCRAKRREYGRLTRGVALPLRRQKYLELRIEVLQAYGGKCACCGETEQVFLEVDHIDGGGTKHRHSIGKMNLYHWYKANGYPAGHQILCSNCHKAKTVGVVCPHKREESVP